MNKCEFCPYWRPFSTLNRSKKDFICHSDMPSRDCHQAIGNMALVLSQGNVQLKK